MISDEVCRLWSCSLVVLCSVAACSREDGTPSPKPAPSPPVVTASDANVKRGYSEWYRAVVGEAQGTAIPFYINVPSTGDTAFMVNGPDRVRATIDKRDPQLEISFGVFRTRIVATPTADGGLAGTFESASGSWGAASLSFSATAVPGHDPEKRFPVAAGPDLTGTYRVKLPNQPGKLTIKHGEGNELVATFAFESGNLAFLSGAQEGKTLRLSAFDGSSPYLLVATFDEATATLTGTYTAGQSLGWRDDLTATRGADFELVPPMKLARKRAKVSSPHVKKHAGKPLIVELGGSWCPACGHASKKLKELRQKYAAEGLEVIMLSYEFTDDPAYNKAQVEMFKRQYDIPWEVVPIDGGLASYDDIVPPELDGVDPTGFPITLFVARDGSIEGFHNGYASPTWGEANSKADLELDRLATLIVRTK